MRRSVLICLLLTAVLAALSANAVPGYMIQKQLYATDRIKVQLTEEAYSLTNIPKEVYAKADSFKIDELDRFLNELNVSQILRAHRQVKNTAWEKETGFDRWFILMVPTETDILQTIKILKTSRFIEQAVPEFIAYTQVVPNDTYYANNWGHNNTAQLPVYQSGSHSGPGVGTIGYDSDAQLAWDHTQGYGYASIIIAVIDTGVDTTHPDLRLVTGYDYGDNDSNPMDDSSNKGHGTSCSGVAAGKANNSIGVTGIAGGCSVMPLKVANSQGNMYFTAIDNAVTHAADYNAHIISMSLGAESGMGEGDSPTTDAALTYAYNAGVVIFAATANSNTSTIAYPSNHTAVISVGASSPTGQRKSTTSSDGEYWWGSNYGSNVQDAKEAVDIMAPTILPATDIVGTTGYSSTDYYMWFNGTSCATPYAAGVAGLILSKDPSLTPAQVRSVITSTATDMTIDGGAGWDRYTGYGMVNANAALNSLISGMPSCTITAPANGSVFDLNSTITVNVTATDSDGFISNVAFYLDNNLTPSFTDYAAPYTWNWNTTGVSGGEHTIRAVATDNNNNTAARSITITLLAPPDEGFESGGFSAFAWNNTSAVPWTVQTAEKFSGTYAAKSGAIGNNASTTLSFQMNVSANGNISFFKKVSSESGYDFLTFYIDGAQQAQWSGEVDWSFQSYPVTSGTHTFSWTYSKDTNTTGGSDCAWLDHITFPPHGVYYAPPQNLIGAPGNNQVILTWQAPGGATPTGYKIFKNGSLLTMVTGLTYTDNAVVNGTTYSYYLTAVYAGGESEPTPTVQVTPNLITSVIIGSGTSSNATNAACPINVYYQSLHGQAVYTAAELNAAGVFGPIDITQIGFNVTGLPTLAMPNYIVRMGHTTASNVASWISTGLSTYWSATSYQPTSTGWNMLTLSTPFTWNGTDNIVIDTAFGLIGSWNQSGTTMYTTVTSGYRYSWNDYSDQTDVFSGGYSSSNRPNLQLTLISQTTGPEIVVDPASLAFGAVVVGNTNTLQFTIENTGDEILTGNITTPAGYSVALASRIDEVSKALPETTKSERNTISYSVNGGAVKTYNLTFAPTAVQSYNGNVVISSNDPDHPSVNITVTGVGYIPPTISIDNSSLFASLSRNQQGTDSFTISNLGSQNLSFSIAESPAVAWFSASPATGVIGGSGSQLITGSFNANGMSPGTYETTLLVNSNDPNTPQTSVTVEMEVINTAPTIALPASFEFDMNGSLPVNFDPYVDDTDGQTLVLGYSGNTNVQVAIDGLNVTFTASPGWYGSEAITFSVYDGFVYAYDTVTVNVNLNYLDEPQISSISKTTNGITIQWAAVPNANVYHIYRAFDPYGTYTFMDSTGQTTYEDWGTFSKAFYRIIAVNNPPAK